MRWSCVPWAPLLVVFVIAGCGSTTAGPPDGNLVCSSDEDCQAGFRCSNGTCIERPTCTDFDGDGYCDVREGYDDCNDNRAEIHPGAEELCDGRDNDCDELVDEDCPCEPGDSQPCGTDLGACTKGTQDCENGTWGDCVGGRPAEPDEICDDDVDNDCNGAVNDGCGCEPDDSRACGSSLGICTAGVQTCVEQAGVWEWSGCQGGTPAGEEICDDDLDNDCDGSLDNGCACDEVSRPCGLNVGLCHAGIQNCVAEVWAHCDGARMPEDEVCDGLDNDCDQLTDEGCECLDGQFEACGTDLGECSQGSRHCVRGHWDPCEGEVPPVAELCDGRDNDCDGEYDEDFPDLLTDCASGVGGCARPGAFICRPDGGGTTCNATPGQPTSEFCNSVDDDCDGQTDEDFPGVGDPCDNGLVGLCFATGVYICDPFIGQDCNAPILPPQQELCDQLDNDCDGSTDENYPLGQSCSLGIGECITQGTFVCDAVQNGTVCDATPPAGSAENCNGLDDDCDGRIDEDLQRDCTSQCGAGYEFCVNGTYGNCSAAQPSAEICDYQDNDCDGQTDEGVPNLGNMCQAGQGACMSLGYFVCGGGGTVVCNSVPGTPVGEGSNYTCEDGIDNDCDGDVDGDDGDCSSCRNLSMQDLYGLQFLAGGLGLAMFRRRRRRRRTTSEGGGS